MSYRIMNRMRRKIVKQTRTQRGFSLWELAVVVGLVALGLTAGSLLLKASDSSQRESDRIALLQAANFAIASFISENGRLPCPATNLDSGEENCSAAGQKGWLPVATLGLDATSPAKGVQQIRYVVYRNAAADLADPKLKDRFQPSGWEKYADPSDGKPISEGQTNALDFCEGLTQAIKTSASPSSSDAYVLTETGDASNVAYALADPGIDRDSDGNRFDSVRNFAANDPGFESPLKPEDKDYDDRVFARTFLDLANHLSCPQGKRSLDVLAQTAETASEVTKQKMDNAMAMLVATTAASVKFLLAGNGVRTSYLLYGVAAEALVTATAGFAVNSPLCAIPLSAPVNCPLMATFATAMAEAVAAQVAAAVAIAAYASALVLDGVVTVESGITTQKAIDLAGLDGGVLLWDLVSMQWDSEKMAA
ncbi:MAG: type II secretion system protein [Burkholderiales bacterium]|nr:type II secretion system protein [Burkholderiales bacterium]